MRQLVYSFVVLVDYLHQREMNIVRLPHFNLKLKIICGSSKRNAAIVRQTRT